MYIYHVKEEQLNMKDRVRNKAYLRAQRTHQGKNHWHVNKRTSVIVCKFCETRISIWNNPKYCPNCLDGKTDQ